MLRQLGNLSHFPEGLRDVCYRSNVISSIDLFAGHDLTHVWTFLGTPIIG